MTLVEKLGERDGQTSEYKWKVEIWRADTTALANLRVRTRVYHIHERSWWPSDRWERVYSDVRPASEHTVGKRVEEQVAEAEEMAERFASEQDTVNEVLTND